MPRTLPWLLEQENEKQVKAESTPRKHIKCEPTTDADVTPKNPPLSPDRKDFFRSSQSPPTSPARACPSEEFLIEGLDKDDGWIMVEDEFYAVAQSFTQHLHYAEYLRRKKEAKAQSAEAIRDIERPTDGRTAMPKELQRRKDVEARAARQKAGLEQITGQDEDKNDEEGEDEDTWAGTHLHGFITSPRKARSLVGASGLKSSTRAAAGFGQAGASRDGGRASNGSPSALPSRSAGSDIEREPEVVGVGETESEDDDLDGHHHPATASPSTRPNSTTSIKKSDIGRPNATGDRLPTPKRTSIPARTSFQKGNGFKSRVQSLFDDLDELPEQTSTHNSHNKEPASAEQTPKAAPRNNNLESKKSRFNDVPTFLM